MSLPECRGDAVIRYRGWRFKAIGGLGIEVRLTRGNKRFVLSGGDAC